MSNQHFQKFANKKKNSAIKEGFKAAKKKAKKERATAINQRFEEKRRMKAEGRLPTNENLHPKDKDREAVVKPKATTSAAGTSAPKKEVKETK